MTRATCKVITLKGDKHKPEPATHIIEFPGGSIEVTRTTDGDYWAHIAVNRGQALDDCEGFHGNTAQVVDARIDRTVGSVEGLPDHDTIQHIAIRISSKESA